ncbi:hypothetical protein HanOQP8_Chr01g0023061 [Helianthus annuus]|nr:hypothetical protein HanOQP8_Chr01g0023061 [Helianthus annuus]
MTSSCLTKSKNFIIYNIKFKSSFTDRISAFTNSLFHHRLLHTISPLPVPKHAGYSRVNRTDDSHRFFELAYVQRRLHSTVSVSSDVTQLL